MRPRLAAFATAALLLGTAPAAAQTYYGVRQGWCASNGGHFRATGQVGTDIGECTILPRAQGGGGTRSGGGGGGGGNNAQRAMAMMGVAVGILGIIADAIDRSNAIDDKEYQELQAHSFQDAMLRERQSLEAAMRDVEHAEAHRLAASLDALAARLKSAEAEVENHMAILRAKLVPASGVAARGGANPFAQGGSTGASGISGSTGGAGRGPTVEREKLDAHARARCRPSPGYEQTVCELNAKGEYLLANDAWVRAQCASAPQAMRAQCALNAYRSGNAMQAGAPGRSPITAAGVAAEDKTKREQYAIAPQGAAGTGGRQTPSIPGVEGAHGGAARRAVSAFTPTLSHLGFSRKDELRLQNSLTILAKAGDNPQRIKDGLDGIHTAIERMRPGPERTKLQAVFDEHVNKLAAILAGVSGPTEEQIQEEEARLDALVEAEPRPPVIPDGPLLPELAEILRKRPPPGIYQHLSEDECRLYAGRWTVRDPAALSTCQIMDDPYRGQPRLEFSVGTPEAVRAMVEEMQREFFGTPEDPTGYWMGRPIPPGARKTP